MQLLRHGLGVWRRPQRAAVGRDAEAPSRQASLHRHQDPSEEPQVAGAAVVPARRRLSCRTTSANTPRRASRTSASRRSTCSSCTCGPMSGRPTIAGSARLRALKDEGLVRAHRDQRQPLAAGQCAARARERPHRCGAGRLQRLRSESRGRAISVLPEASDCGHRRVPFDEGSLTGTLTRDDDLADGRLPEPLLQPRQPAGDPPPRRPSALGRAGGHVDATAGAAAHPGPPGRLDRHPGDAEARARRAEHRRERRAGLAGSAHGGAPERTDGSGRSTSSRL